ncbi:hypothetical protein D3C76_973900 [compost metagenome]
MAKVFSVLRLGTSITVTPPLAGSLLLLPTHKRCWSGCRTTRSGCTPASRSATRVKVSVSITDTLPRSGIDTNTSLSSPVAAQSIGWPGSSMRARVLVTPPTETVGSITVRLASLFSMSRK